MEIVAARNARCGYPSAAYLELEELEAHALLFAKYSRPLLVPSSR